MNKYLAFAKNIGIASGAAVSAGVGGAELADLITNNNTLISITSTLSEYGVGYAVFLPLHARDNRDLYRTEEGGFKWGKFVKDQVKLAGAFVLLDIAYLVGKPMIMNGYLQQGLPESQASLYSDRILYPALIALSLPLAKISGIIRSNKPTLEEKVQS